VHQKVDTYKNPTGKIFIEKLVITFSDVSQVIICIGLHHFCILKIFLFASSAKCRTNYV